MRCKLLGAQAKQLEKVRRRIRTDRQGRGRQMRDKCNQEVAATRPQRHRARREKTAAATSRPGKYISTPCNPYGAARVRRETVFADVVRAAVQDGAVAVCACPVSTPSRRHICPTEVAIDEAVLHQHPDGILEARSIRGEWKPGQIILISASEDATSMANFMLISSGEDHDFPNMFEIVHASESCV